MKQVGIEKRDHTCEASRIVMWLKWGKQMNAEDPDVSVQMGGGAVDHTVKPGMVKGGCAGEIIYPGLYILGLKSLCNRGRQLICSWKG